MHIIFLLSPFPLSLPAHVSFVSHFGSLYPDKTLSSLPDNDAFINVLASGRMSTPNTATPSQSPMYIFYGLNLSNPTDIFVEYV